MEEVKEGKRREKKGNEIKEIKSNIITNYNKRKQRNISG